MYGLGLGRQEHFDTRNTGYLIADNVVDPDAHARAILASRGPLDVEAMLVSSSASGASELDAKSQTAALAVAGAGGPGVFAPGASSPSIASGKIVGPGITYRYWNDSQWYGDQGETEECTAWSSVTAMADGPVTHPGQNPIVDPHVLYGEIQAVDRSEGRVYAGGATSLAMAKALMARKYIGSYLWGYTLQEFITALLTVGPVLLGIDWYTGMDSPDRKHAIIRATGSIRGGHEIVANGIDLAGGLVRLKNTWGRLWGKNGHGFLPLEDVEALIADGGDVCLFRELATTPTIRKAA